MPQERAWLPSEDLQLLASVNLLGAPAGHGKKSNGNWTDIAEKVAGRNAMQCRERWCHNLEPALKNGPWSEVEKSLLARYGSAPVAPAISPAAAAAWREAAAAATGPPSACKRQKTMDDGSRTGVAESASVPQLWLALGLPAHMYTSTIGATSRVSPKTAWT